MSPGFWTNDVDRVPNQRALEILSAGTAVSMGRLAAMGLSAYDGLLWPSYPPNGPLAWVMPIGRYGRRRRSHGQQFCRRCLAEDEKPFFRRRWRLAFNVVCERHAIMLDDACRLCGAHVEFHVGDFGKRLLDFECPITRCSNCGTDLRFTSPDGDRAAPGDLLWFQSELSAMLREGWSPVMPGGGCYSFLAFEGLRCIVRLLESRSCSRRLRDLIQAREGALPLGVSAQRPQPRFEELRLCDRSRILLWCAKIIRSWPDEFIRLCREAHVSSSYVLFDKGVTPYWLASIVDEHLYDRDYQPSQVEWSAVRAWLAKTGLPVTTNSIRQLLGLSHTRNNRPDESVRTKRWNPRGPKQH